MDFSEWAHDVPPVSVVGNGFCFPYVKELIVRKTIRKLSSAQFDVLDVSGNLLLQVDGGVWNIKMKRTMHDPAGFPILTMRGKALTFWHKWRAYEGINTQEEDMIFSVKQSHPIQMKKELHIHLANNSEGRVPDFRVTGSYTSLSFKVYQGPRLIAEAKHNFTLESFYKGKEMYRVKIYPEVDYAFIVALLVVVDENDTP